MEKRSILLVTNLFLATLILGILVLGGIWYLVYDARLPDFLRSTEAPVIYEAAVDLNPKVPFVSVQNNQGHYQAPYSRNAVAAATIAVTEYWFPGEMDIAAIDTFFTQLASGVDLQSINGYLSNDERFSVRVETLSVDEIGLYLNGKDRVPLITNLPTKESFGDEPVFAPTTVVTAIDTDSGTITVQNYWSGVSTISLTEYQKLQSAADWGNQYVVIEPASGKEGVLRKIESSDIEYTKVRLPEREASLFEQYGYAEAMRFYKNYPVADKYYNLVVSNPLFVEIFPPVMRVIALSRKSEVEYALEKYEVARQTAIQAVGENANLDEPFSHFGSYDYLLSNNAEGYQDVISLPYLLLGDAERALGNKSAAIEAYESALEIYPDHNGPALLLEQLKQES